MVVGPQKTGKTHTQMDERAQVCFLPPVFTPGYWEVKKEALQILLSAAVYNPPQISRRVQGDPAPGPGPRSKGKEDD